MKCTSKMTLNLMGQFNGHTYEMFKFEIIYNFKSYTRVKCTSKMMHNLMII